jgi:multiple sugar transport system ATP-binding protein/alpha-glucoside transport system ATP-binding protein
MSELSLMEVQKRFGSLEVIRGVNLQIKSGELVVFVGPSGCGKSTLLRMIAGLEEISGGHVSIGGEVVNDIPPSHRGIAMVFQSYALYPHMTVYDNMAFGLRNIKMPKAEIETRVSRAAEILQIQPLLDRLPRALSGGQRQRVAIGRAIVRDPQVFLFDEPLSNLDAALRVQTRIEIARLHNTLKATMIYVTHDQVEAMTLADRIVVLNSGQIEQVGTPLELYDKPQNMFVAGFIGSPRMNFIPAQLRSAGPEGMQAELPGGGVLHVPNGFAPGAITLGIRPEHLRVASPSEAILTGTVEIVEQLGEYALVHARLGDNQLVAKVDRELTPAIGHPIHLGFGYRESHLFNAAGAVLRATQKSAWPA